MADLMTKREWFKFYNSLLCLAKGLENHSVVIDLRNEVSVSGKITYVDGYMNVSLENATFFEYEQPTRCYESFFVPARNIRNFILPDNIPIKNFIKNQVEKQKAKRGPSKRRTLKVSRAIKQRKEIMRTFNKNQNN